jgi:hypothetical protein
LQIGQHRAVVKVEPIGDHLESGALRRDKLTADERLAFQQSAGRRNSLGLMLLRGVELEFHDRPIVHHCQA